MAQNFDLLLKDGTVADHAGVGTRDIGILDGKIAALGDLSRARALEDGVHGGLDEVVVDGDLVHADRHGAVVIPHASVPKVLEAAALLARREKVLLDAARKPGFSVETLREAFSRADEIH